jgi:hypothetical protein
MSNVLLLVEELHPPEAPAALYDAEAIGSWMR